MLFCAVAKIKRSTAHILTDKSHKFVEGVYKRLDEARMNYVLHHEKQIKFGDGIPWADVEADEVDLRKTVLEPDAPQSRTSTAWEQWGGIVQRGAPEKLVLVRLQPNRTKVRAPGPGAMRKRDWKPIANRFLKNRQVILHTDGARAYTMKVPSVIHDNVVHRRKLIKRGSKNIWVKPAFTKVMTHKFPDKSTLRVKAGTQVIDRFWRHLRAHLEGVSSSVGSKALHLRVRSAQWTYWHRGTDQWAKTGERGTDQWAKTGELFSSGVC